MQKSIRNIGIFAHVDAGKTSITENMLFLSGKTKFLGSVDDGNTHSDFLAIEKQRGISGGLTNNCHFEGTSKVFYKPAAATRNSESIRKALKISRKYNILLTLKLKFKS